MKNDSLKGQHRINEQIRAKEVRIVGDEVEPKVYPIAQALKMACLLYTSGRADTCRTAEADE